MRALMRLGMEPRELLAPVLGGARAPEGVEDSAELEGAPADGGKAPGTPGSIGSSGVGSGAEPSLGGAMGGRPARRRGQISRLFHMACSSKASEKAICPTQTSKSCWSASYPSKKA